MLGFDARTRALLAAVARHGSVAAAARAVGLDPSNARRHLRTAERRAGARLVELRRGGSDGRNARLTGASRRLLGGGGPVGVVGEYDPEEGATPVRLGRRALHAAGRHPPGPALVRVPPEAVALSRRAPEGTSARNALPMVVESLREEREGLWRARLASGALRLEALVTRGAVRDLRLRRGSRVVAAIKATAVEVSPLTPGGAAR